MLNPVKKRRAQARGLRRMNGYILSPFIAAAVLLLDSGATARFHDISLSAREVQTELPAADGPAHHTTGAAGDSDHEPADSHPSQPAKPTGMPEPLFRFEEQGHHAHERRDGERRQNLPVLY